MGGAAGAEILLVEDDRQLATMLTTLLAEEGYRVQVAGDGQAGLHLGLTRRYRALIVDRGLPVRDGLEVLRILRSNGVVTPALVLTARGALADRVEGLDAGAEDYLVKPFEVAELLARIRALLRRNAAAAESLPVARWRLDLARRTAVDPDRDTRGSGTVAARMRSAEVARHVPGASVYSGAASESGLRSRRHREYGRHLRALRAP